MNSTGDNRNHSPAGGFTSTHSAPNQSTGTNAPFGTRSYTPPSTTTRPTNAANATTSPPGVHLNASPHCVRTPTSTPDPEPTTGTSLLAGSQRNISSPENKNWSNSSTTGSPYATVRRQTAENTASQHQAGRQAPNPTPALVSNGGATWPETGSGSAQQVVRSTGPGALHKTRNDHTPPTGRGTTRGGASNRAQTHNNSEATPNTQNQPPPAPTPKKHRKIRARVSVTGGWGPHRGVPRRPAAADRRRRARAWRGRGPPTCTCAGAHHSSGARCTLTYRYRRDRIGAHLPRCELFITTIAFIDWVVYGDTR